MDPHSTHSRHSQYNNQQRRPKYGPPLQNIRQMEVKTTNVFEHFRKDSTSSLPTSTSLTSKVSKENVSRPIASNSRVRRDEKYKRDMYLAFIDNALTQKARGVNEHYDDLVRQFDPVSSYTQPQQQTPMIQQFELRSYITALTHVVSKLDRDHRTLVDAIVGMPWMTMDSAFVKAYVSFIGMLVSARPEYLTLVLEKAAQNLTYHSARRILDTGIAESSSTPLTRRIVYDRVHSLIFHLLELIPTLPSTLHPLLVRNFPHKRQREAEHVTYIRNLLRLSDYCYELWDRILGLIIDRTIQIDVEIQVELEDLEAEGAGEEAEEVFHLDPFDSLIGQEGDEDSDSDSDSDTEEQALSDISSDAGTDIEDKHEEELDTKHVRDMVAKLDSILEVIFRHLDRMYKQSTTTVEKAQEISSEESQSNEAGPLLTVPDTTYTHSMMDSHFNSLLTIFERTILRTFKSRYTQFLVFWYSSLDNQFRDHFLGTVISAALLEPSQPVVTRAAAASYVASYVSRASFVARDEAQMVVNVLCQFLETHLDEFDLYEKQRTQSIQKTSGLEPSSTVTQQSSEQHTVFYAVAQAIFLIFCFRWRDLMQREETDGEIDELGGSFTVPSRAWIPQLNVIQRAVNSTLNPLKVCSPNVVQQFARVAQHVGFVYCFSILEANRRSDSKYLHGNIPAISSITTKQSFDADLTTFFPFDPYRLPRSSSYIESIYREWSSVAIDDSDEEDEDDGDEEEDYTDEETDLPKTNSEGDLYMHGPSSFADETSGLGESFGGMSISPAPLRPIA